MGITAPGQPWVLIGAVSAACAAALALVLALAGYWWRTRKAAAGAAVRSNSGGASEATGSISSMPYEAPSPRLALQESEVFIPVDATGRPRTLGEGAHGQVQH